METQVPVRFHRSRDGESSMVRYSLRVRDLLGVLLVLPLTGVVPAQGSRGRRIGPN
jgi:hypothetical protein